ncbi:MAG TPA: ATP-binding protein, partial [Clostridia bacterium]|nr:ATP-binding protein [Clostridia bacterium]
AVYMCDSTGAITFYNERAETLWGRSPKPEDSAIQYCGCLQARVESGDSVKQEELPLVLTCREGKSFRNLSGVIERPDKSRVDVLVSIDPVRSREGQVIGAISVLTDVSERESARKALQNQNRRLGLLNETAAHLLSATEPERALASIYEQIAAYFQTSGFFEFEVSKTGDELVLKSCVGVGEPERDCGRPRLRMGEGILGVVAQQRMPVVLGQVRESRDPDVEYLQELGVQAYACYPLVVGERLLGTLSFASRDRECFEPEDQEFFQTLASYVALAREREQLYAELKRHAENLESMVRDRTVKLREMVSEMEHMSYSIVHDMRAPLRAIQGFITMIEKEEGGRLSVKSQDLFDRIITSTNRMDLLITDALNYNKAVRSELHLKSVDAGKLLRDMVRSYPEFQPSRAEVRVEGEFPLVQANEAGLTQCFSNLLSNAVKFVRPGCKARVRAWAERRGGTVRMWIEDEGTGIPKEGQEKIFQMFQRMHGTEYEGTGIGLALVRKVMERMGGRAGVESEEGRGSRFWLELKAAESAEERPSQDLAA